MAISGKAELDEFPSKNVSLWMWNVNGVGSVLKKGSLQEFIENADPDILCLNEIKTDSAKALDVFAKQLPEGYQHYWNCSEKKGYAGTAIFSKVKPKAMDVHMGVSKHDQEGRIITLEFEEFVLVAVYVPNSGDDLRRLSYRTQEWDKDFFDFLDGLRRNRGKPLIVTGDLNVAH